MQILLLGSGGRENALAWKIAQSKKLKKLWIAPGNSGTSQYGENVDISPNNFDLLKSFVVKNNINIIVVGPEEPLVNGIHDYFLNDESLKNLIIIGPQKSGALLEGSKDFSKQFMKKYNIPTAAYRTFTKESLNDGITFLKLLNPPYVLKADGLAAGKGVIICSTLNEAENELKEMLDNSKFGLASQKVVIEEFLSGIELSVFIVTDGKSWKLLPEAKDYKKIGEGDTGLNTGGMGSVSPVPFINEVFKNKIINKIINPTIEGLKNEKIDYKGFIFFGLIKVKDEPYVIEYNARLGDPETESIVPRIKTDIIDIFEAIGNQTLDKITIEIDNNYCVTVMLVSGGYPGNYEKGKEISGFDNIKNSLIFHAGTITDKQSNKIVTNGGRVIAVTSLDKNLNSAVEKSVLSAETINYEGKIFRKDIGKDMLKFVE